MTIDKAIRYPVKKNGTTFFPKQKKDPSKVARGPEVSGIPKHFGKGKHRVDLAYITPDEAKLLTDLDIFNNKFKCWRYYRKFIWKYW